MHTVKQPRRRNNGGASKGAAPSGNTKPSKARFVARKGRQGAKKTSSIDPQRLIQRAEEQTKTKYTSQLCIKELPISQQLRDRLLNKGYDRPTEIQEKTLDCLLQKRDLLGIAQTGTGKTGAFLIPIIEQLINQPQNNFALVLVPTRELANQVEDEFRSMTKGLKLQSSVFIGGTNINRDLRNLRYAGHVIIATPGRLLDLVQRKALDLSKINTLVLDEFDRMLDMGFVHDVKRIVRGMQMRKQTMLFSATLDRSQEALIGELLTDPVTIKVSTGQLSSEHIEQNIIELGHGEDKMDTLKELIMAEGNAKILLFDETKHGVKKLAKQLNQAGILTEEIHGNKSQNARQSALKSFKEGKVNVLVATDVAARGIDVDNVALVINYQMPMTFDNYIHRIGRSGRAGKSGRALTFVTRSSHK